MDKTIDPIKALQAGNLTTAAAQQMYNGVIPIGDYKGVASILDLDALVKQPLVEAEQKHILGILDGREEDYDLQTLSIVLNEGIGTAHVAALTVPAGEVWYVNVVRGYVPATVGMTVLFQWYCSLWTDRAVTPSGYGQPFYAAPQTNVAGGPYTYDAEFDEQGPIWAVTNKHVALRLPAGTILSCGFVTASALGEAIDCLFQVFGFIGKALVD